MSKIWLSTQLPKDLLAAAEMLVAAGHFRNLDDLFESALRAFLQEQAGAPSDASLASRMVQGLMTEFDPLERAHFEEIVMAYVGVAQHVVDDDELVSLIEIFRAYGFKRVLAALHDAQDSRVPISPRYLETILEKNAGAEPEGAITAVTSVSGAPERVRFEGDNPLAAEVATLYQREIGELTAKVGEQLIALVEEYPDLQKWHQAFEAAATMNKRSLAYVVGCLRNNGTKHEQKGKGKRGVSQSERHRQEKRTRNQDYEDYWAERLKASQQRKDS